MSDPTEDRILVWDLPLRLFHWGLAVAVVTNVVTANLGRMDIHERSGLTVLALVVFRLLWGFIGGHHARFRNFVRAPRAVLAWLRAPSEAAAPRQAGHSPLAALSVLALLAVTGFMATTGMFASDGILFDGPLAHLAPAQSEAATKIHHRAKLALILLVVLHLVAILVYKFGKKINLTRAMVTGRATDAPDRITGADGRISRERLMAGLAL
ncbi:MAG: cytochrome b/b6 domain-containing protein, partial [Pseudomonadota bacterium]|nr:cytochrome b/b6 domain-containing protein [Pseudomonadota bacterium]